MYYGEIKNCDIANGIGVRVSLFVSGCTNHCEQCFQPETWNFSYGEPFTRQTEETLLSLLAPSYIDGLTLEAAAERMHYSWRQAANLHRQALSELELEPLPQRAS